MDITGELVTIIAQQNACSKWDDKNRKANTAEQKYSIASFHATLTFVLTSIIQASLESTPDDFFVLIRVMFIRTPSFCLSLDFLNFSLTFTKINGQNVVFCNVVINIVYLNLNSIFNNLNAIMTKYRFWQMKTLHFGN